MTDVTEKWLVVDHKTVFFCHCQINREESDSGPFLYMFFFLFFNGTFFCDDALKRIMLWCNSLREFSINLFLFHPILSIVKICKVIIIKGSESTSG